MRKMHKASSFADVRCILYVVRAWLLTFGKGSSKKHDKYLVECLGAARDGRFLESLLTWPILIPLQPAVWLAW